MGFIRKQFSLIVRLLISVAVLAVLAKKLNWSEFGATVSSANVGWLLVGFILIGITMVVGAYRWQRLLHVQGIDLCFSKLFPMNMIGQFFNAFLLGVTGGDVVKIYYVTQATPEKRSAAGFSVIYDRVMGLLGIMVWGLIFTAMHYQFLTANPTASKGVWSFLLICLGALGAILFAMVLPWVRKNSGLWKLEQKLPFHGTIENLSEAFQRYTRSPFENLFVLIISIFVHGCIFLMMFAVAVAIHMPVTFWQLAAIVSIVNVLIAVPISISGLGVRESLFVVFLGLANVAPAQATAFSLIGFGLNLLWSLIGGVYYMRYKKHEVKAVDLVPATEA